MQPKLYEISKNTIFKKKIYTVCMHMGTGQFSPTTCVLGTELKSSGLWQMSLRVKLPYQPLDTFS